MEERQEERWYDKPRSRLIGRLTGELPGTDLLGLLRHPWKCNGTDKVTRTPFGRKLHIVGRNTLGVGALRDILK